MVRMCHKLIWSACCCVVRTKHNIICVYIMSVRECQQLVLTKMCLHI